MPSTAESNSPLSLLRLADGIVLNQALRAVAQLCIADLLSTGAADVAQIASTRHVNAEALYRTLRFLSGHGIFQELAPRRFANTDLSYWLRSDVSGSVRRIVIYRGSSYFVSALTRLPDVIASGQPAHDAFELLRRNADEAQIFDDAMTEISVMWATLAVNAYSFERWGRIADVGGGNGFLLATILRANPGVCGVLAEQPHVLVRARKQAFWEGLETRTDFVPTDFFQAIPAGCRAYIMKNVVHDWDDEHALKILKNCRGAMPDDGVLLLIEYSVGTENTASVGKTIDMVMLASTGGKERTVAEHRSLLAAAGFTLANVIPLEGDVTILESIPA